MISRVLCSVLAVAMAGPCLGQTPEASAPATETARSQAVGSDAAGSNPPGTGAAASDMAAKPYSPLTTPGRPEPVIGFSSRGGYKNGYSGGANSFTMCGPGTQHLARDGGLPLDLSHCIGLCDPCNPWPSCSSCGNGCGNACGSRCGYACGRR